MAKVLMALDATSWGYLLQHVEQGMEKGEIPESEIQVAGKMVNCFELTLGNAEERVDASLRFWFHFHKKFPAMCLLAEFILSHKKWLPAAKKC